MTLYTRSGMPLDFEESPKVWNNPESICFRIPTDIAIDGQFCCYRCGHAIDAHRQGEACKVCTALSRGELSPNSYKIWQGKKKKDNKKKGFS